MVVAPARVEGGSCFCDLVLDLTQSSVLGAYYPRNEIIHVNISVNIAEQGSLDEFEGIEESTQGVGTRVLKDLDEHNLDSGVDAEDYLPTGVPVFEANLQATLWVSSRADLLVLPIWSTPSAKFAKKLERKIWELVEDLVEHASELWEDVADGRVKDLWELAKA